MKKKKGLIIILVIVVILLVSGFATYMVIKNKQEKELAEQQYKQLVYDFNEMSDKIAIKYFGFELVAVIGFRTGVLGDIFEDTAAYWDDYNNYLVYGKSKSKYKLKTFDDVIKKRNKKYKDSIEMAEENKDFAILAKKTLNSIDEHSDIDIINNKKVAINFIDAYIKLHDTILNISNTYYGYIDDYGRAVTAYNNANNELDVYTKGFTDYFVDYKKFVFDNKLDQYCDFDSAQTDSDKNSPMTYYQICDDQIRKQFNLKQYDVNNGYVSEIVEENETIEG